MQIRAPLLIGIIALAGLSVPFVAPTELEPEPEVLQAAPLSATNGGAVGDTAPEFEGIASWINSGPLTMAELRGQVVLIDFWTYTCVNCIRTLPYLTDWDAKYGDKGLVIVGVHSPEFEFEKITENVAEAAGDFGVAYPIAQDNDFGTWRAYNNRYWPAKYLIDQNGVVRYTHFGEGEYHETELAIRELLREGGADLRSIPRNDDPGPTWIEDAFTSQDPTERVTRELYGGWLRNDSLSGLYIAHLAYYEGGQDETLQYTDPGMHINGVMYLHGAWTAGEEAVQHGRATEHYEDWIAMHVFARSANAVIDLAEGVESFLVKVTTEDTETGEERALTPEEAGADIVFIDGESYLEVNEGRMYYVLSLPDLAHRELKFRSNSPDFALFAMTFGAYESVD